NAPTFDWHITNLRNYVNLSVTDVPAVAIDGREFAALGMGSGMHGLPGDFTPPSRFVRAAGFAQAARPAEAARGGGLQALRLLNQFDIPRGSVRTVEGGKVVEDSTQWTAASDLKTCRYYIHTYQNRRIRMVDLRRLDLGAKDVKTIAIGGEEVIE